MQRFATVLRLLSPIFFVAGLMHLVFGVRAEVLLGTPLPVEALTSAGLDSQNRFFAVSFTLYGVLLLLAAKDLPRYVVILRAAFWIVFAAGLARLVPLALHGWPSPAIVLLMALEIVLPPPLLIWLGRLERRGWSG